MAEVLVLQGEEFGGAAYGDGQPLKDNSGALIDLAFALYDRPGSRLRILSSNVVELLARNSRCGGW